MSFLEIIIILIAGTAGGFMNTVAGGGSLITLPALIFLGLPSAVANGTNRIALMAQNITAIATFRSKGFFDWKLGLLLGFPALIGAVLGSRLAIDLPDEIFNRILAIVMIIVLALIIINPRQKKEITAVMSNKRIIGSMMSFFVIGVYGGFIQAGAGFIIIASLSLITGLSLVNINAIKVFITAVYITSSLLVFILSGNVAWIPGLVLAVGNGFGAYLGSVFSVSKGDRWIKIVLTSCVLLMAGRLLNLY